ncbi:DUF4142 domain-containing protein [Myxococcus sp. K15C18031901]|uniref:DUF4142 domain-containing protein n=1 Tax=Myxococcus dinghuensis TaxID=2906761 RepID=UPI0020A78F26|nr:DUF4142 domain-containing protein [Myxococcus dinghuensis]MCP3102520.1 DUF4142 domain-containing protein [Myxococcus dinghuensis]
MRRWSGWMLVGSLLVGGTAVAQQKQGSTQGAQNNGTGNSQGMIRAGEPEAIDHGEDVQKDPDALPGTGGAGADAQASALMKQGMLPVPADEKAFLEVLHHTNQMEVKMGQLAQQNGSSQGVKDYGQRMEKDHGQADQKLMAYAKSKQLTLGEPKADTPLAQAMSDSNMATDKKLQALQGPVFDRAYLTTMVEGHDVAIAQVMAAQQQFKSNTQLTAMLDDLLPQLQQHRQSAYRLLGQEAPRQARRGPQPSGR